MLLSLLSSLLMDIQTLTVYCVLCWGAGFSEADKRAQSLAVYQQHTWDVDGPDSKQRDQVAGQVIKETDIV